MNSTRTLLIVLSAGLLAGIVTRHRLAITSSFTRHLTAEESAVNTQSILRDFREWPPATSIEDALRRRPVSQQLLGICDLIDRTSSDGLASLPKEIMALQNSALRLAITQILFAKWIEIDVDGGFRFVESLEVGKPKHDELLSIFFATWAEIDFAAARTATTALNPSVRRLALAAMSQSVDSTNPRASLILSLNASILEENVAKLWDQIATLDENSAAKLLSSAVSRSVPNDVVNEIVGQLARLKIEEDPDEAINWAQLFVQPSLRSSALAAVFGALAERSPDEATARLNQIPNWQGDSNLVREIAMAMLKTNPQGATEWANKSHAGLGRFELLRDLATKGAQLDPVYAAKISEWAALTTDMPFIEFAPIAGRFADYDPDGALEWFNRMHPRAHADVKAVGSAIGQRWAERNINEAIAQLEYLRTAEKQRGFAGGIAEVLGESNAARGWDWIDSLDEDLQSAAISGLVRGQLRDTPHEAAKAILSVEESPLKDQALHTLSSAWSEADPASAADWFGEQPGIENMNKVVNEIVKQWSYVDPMAASEWLRDLPEGTARDSGAVTLAKDFIGIDPQTAMEWAVSINDSKMRETLVPRLAYLWARTNQNEALDFSLNLGLTEIEQEKLIMLIETNGGPIH